MAPRRILIVGCGIAGSTLASFLLLSDLTAQQLPHITILERAPDMRSEGQNIDIRGAGITIIRKLGIENMIRRSHTGEKGVQMVDADGQVWAALSADKSGEVSTPTADIEILRGRLAQICYERSKQLSDSVEAEGGHGIEYVFGDYLNEIDHDGDQVNVHFANSDTRGSYDIVVGADGLQSRTRNIVWGPEGEHERLKRLGMYGAFFSIPRIKTDTSWRRWFHAPGRRGIMLRPSHRPDRMTVFMYVINDKDEQLKNVASSGSKGIAEQKTLFERYFRDAGWECQRIVDEMLFSKDFYCDLVGQVKMDRWSKGKVVLLGDAGGMGTTLALNGAYNLAGALTQNSEDIEAAFDQYEAAMRPIVSRAQKLVPGMPHLMSPETSWGVWFFNFFVFCLVNSGLVQLIFKFAGPPANRVPVQEFGFRQAAELEE